MKKSFEETWNRDGTLVQEIGPYRPFGMTLKAGSPFLGASLVVGAIIGGPAVAAGAVALAAGTYMLGAAAQAHGTSVSRNNVELGMGAKFLRYMKPGNY